MPARHITHHNPVAAVFGDEFRMGPGYENWRPEGGGDWLLIYTEGGAGRIIVGKREENTRPGDLLLYEPRAAQDYGTAPISASKARWHLLWAHFTAPPSWQAWLQWPTLAPGVRHLSLPRETRNACRDALRRMAKACRHSDTLSTELAMTALKEAILLGRIACAKELPTPADPRIVKAISLLTDRLKKPFYLPDIARECGLSVSRFSHLFRETLGQTPGQWIEQLRLSHAAQLLRLTSLNIAEISGECGFDDPFYFSQRFRKYHGHSPRSFRLRKS